jgi:CopG family nickel-responsive transcriptional regulator
MFSETGRAMEKRGVRKRERMPMSELVRFGVSIEKNLLESFDRFITDHGFFNRSEAIRDLVREKLSLEKGFKTDDIMGTVTIIYNHHIRNLAEHLTDIEHRFQRDILFSNHVHISHDLCLEVIVVKGNEKKLREFTNVIGGHRGVLMALPSFFTFDIPEADHGRDGGHDHDHGH